MGYKDVERSAALTGDQWVSFIEQDFAAGATLVVTEARESGRSGICDPSGQPRFDVIEQIIDSGADCGRLVFEAPTKELQAFFVTRLGSDVNLANVAPGDVIALERLRLGLRSDTLVHFELDWQVMPPPLRGVWAQREATTYVLYLIGGSVAAFHLDAANDWLCRNARLVIMLAILAALGAEAVYFLAETGVTTALGSGNDPFQPSVIPFNVGAIACLYLVGVALVKPGRSRRLGRRGGVADRPCGICGC